MSGSDIDALIRLIYLGEVPSFSSDEIRVCLNVLQEDHESTLPLIRRLLTTGTPLGKERVRYLVKVALRNVQVQVQESHKNLDWKLNCNNSMHPKLSEQLMRNWNISNVVNESGSEKAYGQVFREVRLYHDDFMLTDYSSAVDTSSDTYWRGIAALNITGVMFRPSPTRRGRVQARGELEFYRKSFEFICWAGKHQDVRLVTKTASERQTVDITVLKEAINGDSGVPAISAGAL